MRIYPMYKRILKLNLPHNQSCFLWGPRKTGKTTYLRENYPDSHYIDLLKSENYLKYSKDPKKFREEILALDDSKKVLPVIVDEIQRVPILLNEVHLMIEENQISFILSGSSARKLKRGAANLLGGRAWKYSMFPLVSAELKELDLLKIFQHGLLPSHYLAEQPSMFLQSYVEDYIEEEIKSEGLVRNLPAFANFLDSLAFSNGELINYSNIARDCGVDSKTVKEYYQILVDTLLGSYLLPFKKSSSRQIISATPKFYLFDLGVVSYLCNRSISVLKGSEAGKAFEHFIYLELLAYMKVHNKRESIKFWRTSKGLEVDFVIGKARLAIETKISNSVSKQDIKGLMVFKKENPETQAIVVSLDDSPRKIPLEENLEILILPYKEFLKNLWRGDFV